MRTFYLKMFAAALSLVLISSARAHEFACEKLAGVVTLNQNGSVPRQPVPGGEIIFDAGPSTVFRLDTYPADVVFVSNVTNILDRTSIARITSDTVETLRPTWLDFGVVERLGADAGFPPHQTFWSAVRVHIEDYAQCLDIAEWYADQDGRPVDDRIENRYGVFYDTGYAECRAQVICDEPAVVPAPVIEVKDSKGLDDDQIVHLGDVAVGATSAGETVTVTNTGDAPLTVGTIVAQPPFHVTNDTCSGATFAPGESCTVTVTFQPTAAGPASETLTIPSNDPSMPRVDVDLSGNGTAAVHRMFVTSVSGTADLSSWADAGGQTGLAAGDAICQARADAAGLGGTFRAWLSDADNEAYCRISGFEGKKADKCGQAALPTVAGPWIRTDGYPFAAKLVQMTSDSLVYTPARFDEFGNELPEGLWNRVYFTGTNEDGTVAAGPNNGDRTCAGWTTTTTDPATSDPSARLGDSDDTLWWWYISGCSSSARLLCLEVGAGPALPPFGETGKLAFVTSVTGTGDLDTWPDAGNATGVAAGDAICQARASAAGLPNPTHFKAWLSDDTTAAKDRITSDGPWVRLDGIPVAGSKSDLLDGFLFAPVNVTEAGEYVGDSAWTGTTEDGTASASCLGWTSAASDVTGWAGFDAHAGLLWVEGVLPTCSANQLRLYCFED